MADCAIVVQNFNKPDTLEAVCTSLLTCDNTRQFDLIFWSDSAFGAHKEAEYRPKCAEVAQLLDSFFAMYSDRFRSITLRRNPVNRGTCKTCQIALDRIFETYEFVIFTEDDTVFSQDALDWFIAMRNAPAFRDNAVWAIAGESIFFDGRTVLPDKQFTEAARLHAVENQLWEKFIPLEFIPSTCFATNRQKWIQFSETRGQPLGDMDVCHRCQAEGKKCLFPVVARVKDIGMLHPDGYSVSIHTKENVTGVKSCYLMSDETQPALGLMPRLRPFDGDVGLLFWRSTLLNGFEETGNLVRRGKLAKTAQSANSVADARKAGLAGNWDLALELWSELRTGGLVTAEVGTNIALCQLKLGEREKAQATIQLVLSLCPDDSYAQSIMAHILEADRDFAGAGDLWNSLRQRPGLPEWLTASAVSGALRCEAAGTALGPSVRNES